MAEVIDFSGRKKIKDDMADAERLSSLQSAIHCSQCPMVCAKCGSRGDTTHLVTRVGASVNFRLCPSCLDEYHDLVDYLESGRNADMPSWYNREWARHWLAWLDYQLALGNYVTSPEVLQVIQEIKGD